MSLFNIRVPLQRIIELVAKNKGIGNPTAWASKILKNCELESDYSTYIFLKSHKNLWYGLKDSIQYLPPFCLYVEQRDTSTIKPFVEYIFYFCNDIHNERFLELIRNAFKFNYDNTLDLRLFYMGNPVSFSVFPINSQQFPSSPLMGKFGYCDKQEVSDPSELPPPPIYPSFIHFTDPNDAKYQSFSGITACKLKEYNDLPDTFTISIPLYEVCTETLNSKTLEIEKQYSYVEHIEFLEDHLCGWSSAYEYEVEVDSKVLRATDYIVVFREGNMLPFGVVTEEGADKSRVVWLEQGKKYRVIRVVEDIKIPRDTDE